MSEPEVDGSGGGSGAPRRVYETEMPVFESVEIPEQTKLDFCRLKQADRYDMARSLEAIRLRERDEGRECEKEVQAWCVEVYRRRQWAGRKVARPTGATVKKHKETRKIRRREPDYWGGDGTDPLLPRLAGAFVAVVFIVALAYLLHFRVIREEHFDPVFWQQVYQSVNWADILAGFTGEARRGAHESSPTFR